MWLIMTQLWNCVCVCVWGRSSLCSSGWPVTHEAGLGPEAIPLSWPPEYWDYRHTHDINTKLQTSQCVWLTAVNTWHGCFAMFYLICEPHDHPWGTFVYTVTSERLRLGQEKGDLTGLGQPASIPRIRAWQLWRHIFLPQTGKLRFELRCLTWSFSILAHDTNASESFENLLSAQFHHTCLRDSYLFTGQTKSFPRGLCWYFSKCWYLSKPVWLSS